MLKSYRLAAILLAILNVGDIITTYWAIGHNGAQEANPIGQFLIEYNLLIPTKILIFGFILLGSFLAKEDSQVKPWSLASIWFVTGMYAMTNIVNLLHVFK